MPENTPQHPPRDIAPVHGSAYAPDGAASGSRPPSGPDPAFMPAPAAAPEKGGAAASTPQEQKQGSAMFGLLGTASTMGLHMVSGPMVGGALGWLVDRWAGSWPWGAGIGVLLGVAAGFRNVWADARHIINEQERIDAEQARRKN